MLRTMITWLRSNGIGLPLFYKEFYRKHCHPSCGVVLVSIVAVRVFLILGTFFVMGACMDE